MQEKVRPVKISSNWAISNLSRLIHQNLTHLQKFHIVDHQTTILYNNRWQFSSNSPTSCSYQNNCKSVIFRWTDQFTKVHTQAESIFSYMATQHFIRFNLKPINATIIDSEDIQELHNSWASYSQNACFKSCSHHKNLNSCHKKPWQRLYSHFFNNEVCSRMPWRTLNHTNNTCNHLTWFTHDWLKKQNNQCLETHIKNKCIRALFQKRKTSCVLPNPFQIFGIPETFPQKISQ